MATVRFAHRNQIPRIIAGLMPAPYQLVVDPIEQDDFGFFAQLRLRTNVLKEIELYPYTVVGPGHNRPKDERRIELELKRRESGTVRKPPDGRAGIMIGLRNRDIDGRPAQPLLVVLPFGIFKDVIARNSIQFPQRVLLEAELLGVAAHTKSVNSLGPPTRAIILAMRPDVLPFFLIRLADDFAAPQDWDRTAVSQTLEASRRYYTVPADLRLDVIVPNLSGGDSDLSLRERAVREIMQPIRDKRFSLLVKKAYGQRCAACGIQLDLIEAAHIDPVEDPISTDETQNGIALCALHHLAYDTNLMDIRADGTIAINERRREQLARMIRDEGLADFHSGLRKRILFPENHEERPHAKFFERRAAFIRRT
jgi:hypothetical protein